MPKDLDYILTKAQFAEHGHPLTSPQWSDLTDYLNEAVENWFVEYYEDTKDLEEE